MIAAKPLRLLLHPQARRRKRKLSHLDISPLNDVLVHCSHDPPDERLITTPMLSQAQCDFNTAYGIITCRICHFAVPLDYLHTHATTIVKVQALAGARGSSVLWMPIPHCALLPSKKNAFKTQVLSELRQKLGDDVFIRCQQYKSPPEGQDWQVLWAQDAVPLPGQRTPIQGLRTAEGIVCTLCPDYRTAYGVIGSSMARHRRERHPESTQVGTTTEAPAILQSFGAANLQRYFPCPGSSSNPAAISSISEQKEKQLAGDDDDFAAMLRKDKLELLGFDFDDKPDINTDKNVFDERTLVPFFRDQGVHNFLKRAPQAEIVELLTIRNLKSTRTPLLLRRLAVIVTESFLADCDLAAGMNPVVRRLLRQSNP